jgi:uncharacterized protein (DUF2236 family)
MTPLLPEPDELAGLVPAAGSVVWRYASDARLYTGAGYALIMQVAHPTVGAGVSDHSDFRADPWGRLWRTLDYLVATIYADPGAAAAVAAQVREMHKAIKGVRPDGARYHALEPEPFAWVHATLIESILRAHRHFGVRLSAAETETFYAQWRRLGRLIGVRERDLPGDWAGFERYFDRMVAEQLQDTEAVQDVLLTLLDPAAPPLPGLPGPVWHLARMPAVESMRLATYGLLPPVLRERFGVRWSARDERRMRAMGAAMRAATPLMPGALRRSGPDYLRYRRRVAMRSERRRGPDREPAPSAPPALVAGP